MRASVTSKRLGPGVPSVLPAGYIIGLAGTVWDDLEHRGTLNIGPAYAHLLIYLGFAFVLVGLVIALRTRHLETVTWKAVALTAGAVLLSGVIVDLIWHGMNGAATERNMLLLPGHAIQHIGWLIGLAGTGGLLWRSGVRRPITPEIAR